MTEKQKNKQTNKKQTRYTNLMWRNEWIRKQNDSQNDSQQRWQKEKRCTRTSYESQCAPIAQWFSSLVQVHLFLLSLLTVILSVILLTYSFISPHQIGVPCFFSVCSSYTQGTVLYQVSDHWWFFFVSSSVGFTITSFF